MNENKLKKTLVQLANSVLDGKQVSDDEDSPLVIGKDVRITRVEEIGSNSDFNMWEEVNGGLTAVQAGKNGLETYTVSRPFYDENWVDYILYFSPDIDFDVPWFFMVNKKERIVHLVYSSYTDPNNYTIHRVIFLR